MLNLIIVDDDEALLEGLSTAVDWESLGYCVRGTARNGKEALCVLEACPCDVLLTDIRMGQMDGLRLAEEVSKRFADVHVVIMSAYDDFSYAQQAIRLGVDDYLLKPIDITQLHAVMNKLSEMILTQRRRAERYHALNRQVEELSGRAAEEYLRSSGSLNVGLIEYLVKAVVLGNVESVQKNMLRLREHVHDVGDGSILFMVSTINLLLVRLESAGELTQEQTQQLQREGRDALLRGSPDEAMNCISETLERIAAEKAAEAIGVGVPTLRDIAKELSKPGRDPRDELPAPILRTDVLDIKDLKPGMVLTGTVRNVIDFGVFVDIGVHQDGLVHISQVCNKFIKHPSEAVAVGDVVKVVVLDVDEKKHRISLSMKQVPEE